MCEVRDRVVVVVVCRTCGEFIYTSLWTEVVRWSVHHLEENEGCQGVDWFRVERAACKCEACGL